MKTAYFDCMFGISGDMILGAFVACGLPLDTLRQELAKIHLHGYTLREEAVTHLGIAATHIDVDTEHQHEHRHLSHILHIIAESSLPGRVKDRASRIFTRLAEAEAHVHGTTPEQVHFHEVGAVDAIVDVVGACIGMEYFGIERVVATPIHFGTGTVQCAHGVMPVPVPAVVELTRGIPVVRTTIDGEITTPTGAAILTTLASSFGPLDGFIAETAGYGAGTRRREHTPNVLRLSIGEATDQYEEDTIIVVETTIDDMTPETFGYVSERLFATGGKDVTMTPVYMKKNRPATLLTVLCDESTLDRVLDVIFTETTTIGVRIGKAARRKLKREERTTATTFGPVKVKVSWHRDTMRIVPEYDDCARIARETGTPFATVYDAAKAGNLT